MLLRLTLCIGLLACATVLLPTVRQTTGTPPDTAEIMHFVVVAPTRDAQGDTVKKATESLAQQYWLDVEYLNFSTVTEQRQMLRLLPETDVDGVLLWPVSNNDADYQEELSALKDAEIPTVIIERDIGREQRSSFIASGVSSARLVLEQSLSGLPAGGSVMIGTLSGNGQNQTAELVIFKRCDSAQVAPGEIMDKTLRQLVQEPPQNYQPVQRICLEGKNAQSLLLKYNLINLFSGVDAPALFFSMDSVLTDTAISATKSAALSGSSHMKLLCFGTEEQHKDSLDEGVLDGLMTSRPEMSAWIGLRYLRDLARGFWVPASMDSGIDFLTPGQQEGA